MFVMIASVWWESAGVDRNNGKKKFAAVVRKTRERILRKQKFTGENKDFCCAFS